MSWLVRIHFVVIDHFGRCKQLWFNPGFNAAQRLDKIQPTEQISLRFKSKKKWSVHKRDFIFYTRKNTFPPIFPYEGNLRKKVTFLECEFVFCNRCKLLHMICGTPLNIIFLC